MSDMTRSPRAVINLQLRLYDLTRESLGAALDLSAQAGPAERLDELLVLIEDATAAVRAAIAAGREV